MPRLQLQCASKSVPGGRSTRPGPDRRWPALAPTCSISVLICIFCGSSIMARFTLKSPRSAKKLQRNTWGGGARVCSTQAQAAPAHAIVRKGTGSRR